MPDHGSIHLGSHRLRQLEQAMAEYRGTFIVESLKVSVIPAWRVDRERRAQQMTQPKDRSDLCNCPGLASEMGLSSETIGGDAHTDWCATQRNGWPRPVQAPERPRLVRMR